jgi:hypothetical protein
VNADRAMLASLRMHDRDHKVSLVVLACGIEYVVDEGRFSLMSEGIIEIYGARTRLEVPVPITIQIGQIAAIEWTPRQ